MLFTISPAIMVYARFHSSVLGGVSACLDCSRLARPLSASLSAFSIVICVSHAQVLQSLSVTQS